MSAPRFDDGILVANRGEIALRVLRTARSLGYRTIAVYAGDERGAPHAAAADTAVLIESDEYPTPYLDAGAVLAAARSSGAQAIHPGYGFLSERADFVEHCERAGIVFIGPSAAAMRALGDKANAKRVAEAAGVPVVPGYHGAEQSDAAFIAAAAAIGYPVMVKAAAGGGGRGMRLARDAATLPAAIASARAEAEAAFGDGTLLLERAIVAPRHVEVQIVADSFGSVVHLGERDCSVQRRHQKLIEESPSPAVDGPLRSRLGDAAIALARASGYTGAGTVEFLLDQDGAFAFIEANARLQVEHPVTEAISGVDLVELQIRIARGEPLPVRADEIALTGHAIEARLCAEDPAREFLPQTGTLARWIPPRGVRVDSALVSGCAVSDRYDSLLAKIVAHGPTRDDARRALARALDETVALGVTTNAAYLAACLRDEVFATGAATTAFVADRAARSPADDPMLAADAIALAAALRYTSSARRSGFGEWTSWCPSERPSSVVSLRGADGTTHTARVAGRAPHVSVTVDERRCAVTLPPDGDGLDSRFAAGVAAREYRVAWVERDERIVVALGPHTFAFDDIGRRAAAALRDAIGDGVVRAPTSGRVLAIRASAGDEIAAGAVAVVLESMKMEFAVTAPRAGALERVCVRVGDHVGQGDELVVLSPAS